MNVVGERLDEVLVHTALEIVTVPLAAEVLIVVDDDLAAGENSVDVTVDVEAFPGTRSAWTVTTARTTLGWKAPSYKV